MFSEISAGIKMLWTEVKDYRRYRNEQYKQALDALCTAFIETMIYLSRDTHSRNEEERLSRLWSKASSLLPPSEHELAKLCLIKASYWANPEGWGKEDIREAKIEIEHIKEEIQRLFCR